MTVRKRGEHWYVDISQKGRHRIQRVLKGARTKAQALKAEAKLRTQIFEKKYNLVEGRNAVSTNLSSLHSCRQSNSRRATSRSTASAKLSKHSSVNISFLKSIPR
jgi:hypothetical protein